MSQSVLAIAEQLNGVFRKVTYEALSEGRRIADRLGCDLSVLVLGSEIQSNAKELEAYGADKILVADSPAFNEYLTDIYTHAADDIIRNTESIDVLQAQIKALHEKYLSLAMAESG